MTRIVLDTNVFISSFFGGNPQRIIELWKAGAITLCLSPGIVDEYVKVLRRLGFEQEPELKELLKLFASGFHILFTARTPDLHVVEDDPDDNKFIECAVALDADFVITGDKALLTLGDYMGTPIVTPRQFLEMELSKT
ncbi:MAG: putative toxin-antitoxin system toxin component, PIN family [Deltaproteobacteria bacterium]|nr:putative toxin-antitoxin system toxin component, PIN family [Deltaproteobacteria bacterium]